MTHPAVTIIQRRQAPEEYRTIYRVATPEGIWTRHIWEPGRNPLADSLEHGRPITTGAVNAIIGFLQDHS